MDETAATPRSLTSSPVGVACTVTEAIVHFARQVSQRVTVPSAGRMTVSPHAHVITATADTDE